MDGLIDVAEHAQRNRLAASPTQGTARATTVPEPAVVGDFLALAGIVGGGVPSPLVSAV